MTNKTFIIKNRTYWRALLNALNDTCYIFQSYEDREIKVYGDEAIKDVEHCCEISKIEYTVK